MKRCLSQKSESTLLVEGSIPSGLVSQTQGGHDEYQSGPPKPPSVVLEMEGRLAGASVTLVVRRCSTSMHTEENPYSPPATSIAVHSNDCDPKWYLTQAQKYYRRMGVGSLAYIGFVIVFTTTRQLRQGRLDIPETVGSIVWCALLAWLFITMIRIGYIPETEFPAHYKKARWIGIIAGALFFPILGLPAYISLRRLHRYNLLVNPEAKPH